MSDMLIEKLRKNRDLTDDELRSLIDSGEHDEALRKAADEVRRERYGDAVYLRGLIEFTSYCKNNCLYCGLRASNAKAQRYRLSKEEILACCAEGYELGFRTFVLQGGEDPYYTDDIICDIISAIRSEYPDCAITLSIGEKPRESYKRYFEAGANRYLLRHETADPAHYAKLHPDNMSADNRRRCLFDLKEIGYQVGSGFMVGSPYQITDNLIADLRFLQELQPDMIGIGPYITHRDTPRSSSARITITAQATAWVVMPNLSPTAVREKYSIYDNKICTGEESARCRDCLELRIKAAGYRTVTARGDVKK